MDCLSSNGTQKKDRDLEISPIGNCSFSALIDKKGEVVWSCFPRFDGDPIFCSLLGRSQKTSSDIGFWAIEITGQEKSEQYYLRNTAVLCTKLYDNRKGCLEIVDFVPRFESYGREFRPNILIRILTPLAGRPRVQIRLRPTMGYGWGTPERARGSNHIRFLLSNSTVRLTTNTPIAYITNEVFFEVQEPLYLVLMPDESMKNPVGETAINFRDKTVNWWRKWARNLTIPFEWQEQVIRACITLQMNTFEETGAIVNALTTSIPLSPNGIRYDSRYCWLRDSYWTAIVLNQLGATSSIESYLQYLSNIVAEFCEKDEKRIQPVYGISLENRIPEREMHRLPGYRSMGPVKLGNAEAETLQNDVYGSIILALAQLFFDQRLEAPGDEVLYLELEQVGYKAVEVYDKPDRGSDPLIEKPLAIHTFSSIMSWTAADRLSKIAEQLKKIDRQIFWRNQANEIFDVIMRNGWNDELKTFTSTWGGGDVEPLLLLIPELGFLNHTHPQFLSTLNYIEKTLLKSGYICRTSQDTSGHIRATFLYISVISHLGRVQEARELFENMLSSLTHTGLLSESIDIQTKELWGNFPHSGALVGLIFTAIYLSKSWKDAF